MIRRPPRSTQSRSSAASDVYKRQDLSLSEADVLRRTMTEHTPKAELARFERLFLERAAAKGTNPETAQHVYNQLKGFASYGFNKGHAASFGLMAYRTAYLKTHWPAQYTAGLLNAMPVGFYPPFILLDEARRCHILIEKPLVTRSMVQTTAHGMTVQLGLSLSLIHISEPTRLGM